MSDFDWAETIIRLTRDDLPQQFRETFIPPEVSDAN